jgi:putative phosphoribosyl transferase
METTRLTHSMMTRSGPGRQQTMELNRPLWSDRASAGEALADRLADLHGRADAVTLVALPRGGIPVAAVVARQLQLPLVTWSVRKLGHPLNPEYAIGAVAPGGVELWDAQARRAAGLDPRQERELLIAQERELSRRQQLFADPDGRQLQGRQLVVIDDGVATGLTVRAALISLREHAPASLCLAVPVLDRQLLTDLRPLVERLEVLALVHPLGAVGEWYAVFDQPDDLAVLQILEQARQPLANPEQGD